MKAISSSVGQGQATSFDLFRIQRARQEVGICINTLRAYRKDGLPFYKDGKKVYVSKSELAAFIRARSLPQ
jgi:hypothetical protein